MTEIHTTEEPALAGTPVLTEPPPSDPATVAESRYDRSIVGDSGRSCEALYDERVALRAEISLKDFQH